jgi:hypothetical protein
MKLRVPIALLVFLALLLAGPGTAAAAPLPAWQLDMVGTPTAFAPASQAEYKVRAINVGAAPTSSTTTIEATLPAGLSATAAVGSDDDPEMAADPSCVVSPHLVTCQITEALHPGRYIQISILLTVEAGEGALLEAGAEISGGGALQAVTAAAPTRVSTQPDPFGVFDLSAASTDEEGLPAAAGSHPYQMTLSMYFPSTTAGINIDAVGHVRDVFGDLPRGYLVDPAATPRLCTEVELLSAESCPPESQLGTAGVATAIQGSRTYGSAFYGLYNMVPPPGSPASFGFNAEGVGIFVHLLSGVRSDGDYGLYGYSSDILALAGHPVLNTQLQFWGDPSSPSHDQVRGESCRRTGGSCPVPPQPAGLLTAPADCEAAPPRFEARADSWEQPGLFAQDTYEAADLAGAPAPTTGCNAEPFAPTIEVSPSTNVADSPSGLEVDLRQPADMNKEDVAPAPLRDARVTLPPGLVANPSQADGLGACTEAQIGYLGEDEEAGIHFSKAPQSCPEAAKLGTVEVESPLLAEYEDSAAGAGTKLVTDPESGEAIPRPVHGAVYLAKPFENPFGSLLAVYLAVEDEQSGIVAKLAGRVEPDPVTGQLTTVFEENPELPLSAVHLSLFGGARASLTTPISCGTYATTTTLTPWSAPEGADAHPESSFGVSAEPGGGACPGSEAQAPNSPSFSAGTIDPAAGAYSPFVLKLSRTDGSQRLVGIDTTLPPGLSGKLAGIAECSEAQIAQAKGREAPNLGQAEKDGPSCPSSSEVGTVKVAAGSGPNPFWTTGHAYLAGPYKGAPLSVVVIVPAVAGPFDLGAVVSRVALYVDPETAQIHAVSDPFPTILEGIPLDLRTVVLEMGRPQFTLNPTNCSPMSVLGTATSALGAAASLSNPFQVGGCSSLAFKPHLKISLTGGTRRSGHPALKAVLTMPPGGANVASAQVGLPHALFLDQGNLDKVCTQPELRSATCPAASVYGHARAISPLLDAPLEGPVYLGVGYGHKLPDLVADLNGQIRVLLHGKVDTTKQDGIRNTFEVVPDAPVTKFTLALKGGRKYSLIENSESLCAKPQRVSALFVAQNGRIAHLNPKIAVRCSAHKKHGRHRKHR